MSSFSSVTKDGRIWQEGINLHVPDEAEDPNLTTENRPTKGQSFRVHTDGKVRRYGLKTC